MTLFEVELLLAKLTYKPKTRFELVKPSAQLSPDLNEQLERNVIVLIHQEVPDSHAPHNKPITVTYVGSIPFIELEYLSAKAVLGKIWYWLGRMELHEMKEFFRINGYYYLLPHPETMQEGAQALQKVLDELEEQYGGRRMDGF